MYIKPLTQSQLPTLETGAKAFFEELREPGSFSIDAFVRYWTTIYQSGAGEILGAYDGDTLIGALGYVVGPSPYTGKARSDCLFIFVTPVLRGSRAAHLLTSEWILKTADTYGVIDRTAGVPFAMPAAQRLYAGYGFRGYQTVVRRIE
jgi:hypothetical protein